MWSRAIVRRCLIAILVSAWAAPLAWALDPNRLPEQYIRNRWTREQGYPGGAVNAFAQTSDGYLWIGGEDGLVRFDGVSFLPFNHANTDILPASPVVHLATDNAGDLWIHMQNRVVIRYRHGVFERMAEAGGVNAMGRGKDGSVLFVRTWDPLRFVDQEFRHIPMAKDFSQFLVISVAETKDGRLWMGTRDYGVFAVRDGIGETAKGAPDRKVNCLLPTGQNSMWIGTDRGLAQWNGTVVDQAAIPSALRDVQVLSLAQDQDGNLWVGSGRGLMRLAANRTFSKDPATATRGEAVSALFEGREGNLWIGTAEGIERLRDNAFLTYPADKRQGEDSGPVYVDEHGKAWFGPSNGGLFLLNNGERSAVTAAGIERDVVYSIAGGGEEVWVGRQRGGLTKLHSTGGATAAQTYTAADGLAPGSVYAVHRSRDGTVWAGTLGGGVSRVNAGQITTYTVANGLPSNTVSAIEEGRDGTMWFATPSGLASLHRDHWQIYTSREGLPPGRVNCLFADARGILWIGTEVGLAFLRDGRVEVPHNLPEPLLDEILGLAVDSLGDLWMVTVKHLLRAPGDAIVEGGRSVTIRTFGSEDGINAPAGIRRERSVVPDSAGRIWFSLRPGIAVVDPARLAAGSAPALVHMESMIVDGRPMGSERPLRISTTTQRVRFTFMAISLSVPERVQYRYRLDRFDHDWSEPSHVGDAPYTNLGPGTYRFRVIASNSQGMWNSSEASIDFEVVPTIWQTRWFQVLLAAVCLMTGVAIYQFRLRRLTEQLRIRFEERLAERTRIAQELHDTLLQGLLATSMQLHVAIEQLPVESPFRPVFDKVATMMRKVSNESRTAVRGLRKSMPQMDDLAGEFSRVREDSAVAEGMEFRILVEGPVYPLNALARDQVYFIGREALNNAFQHSGAAKVEMEIRYGARDLRLAVRDNGKGIDEQVLRAGREGHWGLVGMRERAEQMGGRFRVWSDTATGTELELIVPAQVAYAGAGGFRRWWRKKLFRRA